MLEVFKIFKSKHKRNIWCTCANNVNMFVLSCKLFQERGEFRSQKLCLHFRKIIVHPREVELTLGNKIVWHRIDQYLFKSRFYKRSEQKLSSMFYFL